MTGLNSITSATEVVSWAEAVEQDNAPHVQEGADGTRTETAFTEVDGVRYKVVTQFKVINKRVPKVVADRKKWVKFGTCKGEPAGPQVATTYVAEEVEMQFTRNRAGEQILDVQEDKQTAKTTSREHCRHCKGNDHWSTHCPYKVMYQLDEETDANADAQQNPNALGLRPDGRQIDRNRSDENTCRVTNLPQEMNEDELRDVFGRIGRVIRIFIARDKVTALPKGFAFVTFESRDDAARAIAELNDIRMYHMVLKVEWTRPSN
uniref:Eukaryotic translation initiation factor 3 subunit G n=1 Tax=Caenorhabditis tropicalis TaxID=1561998 RepID=A0A1I7V105_9PELO